MELTESNCGARRTPPGHSRLKRLAPAMVGLVCALMAAVAWAHSDIEESTARYQLTYNGQKHPSFNSPYAGPKSLLQRAEKMYTFSLTAHWGARLWAGGEVYFNPEIAAGVPFSGDLVGLGGFTNGEITRAAGSTPRLYRQRLFLRQTWNQGGGVEKVESDFNQMAGSVDRNRTVLTIGNFSTLDIFDDNAYAKDPRTQFMNWGHWTHAAWDYAADARGFGWGLAFEIYREDWVYRWGRMTGPKEPNGLAVDFDLLKHYGDQLEIERAHRLNDQPGKLRLLVYRNRAVLADFNDASAYLLANNPADRQTIFSVRRSAKIKSGLGINLEQALNDQIGLFMRAMQSDGKTETYAFTEVDRSLSTGVLISGSSWGRAKDTVGLAFSRNFLSPERRRYLEQGGISFFIGDGQLQYAPETIFEGFYSWGLVKGVWLTGGYQQVRHPGFNASRGPVDVYAARLYLAF